MSDEDKKDSEKDVLKGSSHDPWTIGNEHVVDDMSMSANEQKSTSAEGESNDKWEKNLLNRLAFEALKEQRKTRRWGIFFKSLIVVYVTLIIFIIPFDWSASKSKTGKHTALVEVEGVIADNSLASADSVISGLRAAFKDKKTAGVILRINSPGGSPVQAGYVNDEIFRLKEKYPKIPVYAVITDICASGGYYIAVAADEIYADKASIVGSIGVLMDSFGFVGAMKKLGIERRLLTAGENKGFLDPFSPSKRKDILHVNGLLKNIHKQFIDIVKKGRKGRLKETPDMFSGLVWTGEQGIALGLVDGLGNSSYVAREIIGHEKIVNYSPRLSFLERIVDRFGVTLAHTFTKSLNSQFELR